MRARLLAVAVVAAGVAFAPPSSASTCVPFSSVTGHPICVHEQNCLVDVGECEGRCVINVGTCASGGQCLVNVGYCDGRTGLIGL